MRMNFTLLWKQVLLKKFLKTNSGCGLCQEHSGNYFFFSLEKANERYKVRHTEPNDKQKLQAMERKELFLARLAL
jgi:hypothetical protein